MKVFPGDATILTGVIKLCLTHLEVNGRVVALSHWSSNPLNSPQFLSLVPERRGALISMDHLQSTIGNHQKVVHQMRQSRILNATAHPHVKLQHMVTRIEHIRMDANQYRTLQSNRMPTGLDKGKECYLTLNGTNCQSFR